ncbi:retrovirus-related pol polyprotein from transposon TNT 1-94 [Tanacetum coccineum]
MDTMCFDSSTRLYSYQLDEQWFNLHKDIIRDTLDITPTNDDNPFVAPPLSDTVIRYVNTLGYPNTPRNVSAMSVNALYQPWRAILSMINMCLTGKSDSYDRPRHLVLQILWDQGKKRKLVKETSYVPSPAKRSKAGKVAKKCVPKSPLKLIDKPSDEGVRVEEPAYNEEEVNLQWALELSLKEQGERTQGPARLVVLREPDSGRIQPLLEVQGKGKEKVVNEQAAQDLLTLQTPKKKSPSDQFIFQRRTLMPTEASGHAESPSLDVELALADSEMESDNEVPKINTGDQDESKAGPKPGDQDEDQARSNPGDAAESQPQSSHVVPAGPNLEHMDLEATDASTQQKPKQIDEEFSASLSFLRGEAYWGRKEEPGKPMPKQSNNLNNHDNNNHSSTTTISTTTKHRISNFSEAHSQAVDEIVTDAVDQAMQSSTSTRSKDLPTVDMKEILQQRMFEDNSYKAHDIHNDLCVSGAPSTSEASGSSQLPPPLPLPSTGTSGSTQQQGSNALSSSKIAALASQSMEWTTSDTRYESAESRKDWWKPLPEEERPATPGPAWIIPSSNVSDVKNNWASALVSTSKTPAENSLLANTRDMTTLMKWYRRQMNKTELTQEDFEGQAYEVVKSFYPDVIYLQFQMEECHKMLTNQVDWTNPEGDQVRFDVKRPLPLDGLPGHETIQTHFFFNKDLEYLRYGSKGSSPALSIFKIKVARHDSSSRQKEVRIHMRILSVVRIKAYSRYGYDYLSEIVPTTKADFQEHTIAEKDFKNLYPSDFEDLNLLLLQGHLDHLPGSDKRMLSTAIKLWTQNLVISTNLNAELRFFNSAIKAYQTQLNLTNHDGMLHRGAGGGGQSNA